MDPYFLNRSAFTETFLSRKSLQVPIHQIPESPEQNAESERRERFREWGERRAAGVAGRLKTAVGSSCAQIPVSGIQEAINRSAAGRRCHTVARLILTACTKKQQTLLLYRDLITIY